MVDMKSIKKRLVVVLLLQGLIFVGCGGGSSTSEDTIAPTISGTPLTSTTEYSFYQFQVTASDSDDDMLTFGIENKPSWLAFDEATGKLQGVAPLGSEGNYSNIIISVSDGHSSKSLKPFSIEVKPAQNIAHLLGKATQAPKDGYYYYVSPDKAIDGNLSTYNHTQGDVTLNWWQLELPNDTKIHNIVIHNRAGQQARLNGAKVYVSDDNYTGILPQNLVATLNSNLTQNIDLSLPIRGKYILVKASGTKNLHMTEVEVYGQSASSPLFGLKEFTFVLPHDAPAQTVVGKVEVIKDEATSLTYTIKDTVPFMIDNNGVITLSTVIDYNRNPSYTFSVEASDGEKRIATNVVVKLFSKNGVKQERWYGIDGTSIASFLNHAHYGDAPDETKIVDDLDMNENKFDNFGQKMTTILKVEEGGYYIFAIVGDDGTELRLNGEEIAHKSSWSGYQNWSSAGKSATIKLNAGRLYRLEAFLKEGGGAERVSVGWKKESESEFTVIPANQLFLEVLDKSNVKPIFEEHVSDFTIQSANAIGDNVLSVGASDSQGDALSYTIIGDVPFIIDANGQISISGLLEIKTYSFDVEVTDETHTVRTHVNITSTANTAGLNDSKEDFYTKARAFGADSNVDELVTSYLAFAHEKAQFTYNEFMPESADADIWEYINSHSTIKEGLYASRFPVNPYFVKNLADILNKWKEDGKDETFIEKYKNVALGLAINAREAGVFKEVRGGDTWEHPTIDYSKLAHYEAKERRWREHFDYDNLGYGIGASDLKKYMQIKYQLSASEADSIWHSRSALKKITTAGNAVDDITYALREQYGLSFDGLNLYRLSLGLSRISCNSTDNPCPRIEAFITEQGISKTQFLGDFKNYKGQVTGLINPLDSMAYSLRGELGVIPKENNDYRLMSFYALANWKILNDETPAKDFGDSEPNWPIFNAGLSTLPWQLLALTQSAQKQECEYVKRRFFETDKAVLRETYPPHAVDSRDSSKEKRFKEYTTYTWDYNTPSKWFAESDWSPNRSYYRILQDGGVCGRQSTMGQHLNECLNRPSIGVGQPGHRAWVGVYNSKANPKQYQTNIGYQVGSRESATAHSKLIYNHYTKAIRETGMERITGVATGVSPASVGEHSYNQSMIFQHIGKLLEEDGVSAEAVLKKSVDLAPQNVDAWYQLALYYATLDKPEKVIALAKEFMDKRDTFFLDTDNRKGAENIEVVTGKNIAFIALKAPSIANGSGDRAEWGETQLWSYLDTYEAENRSLRSYRNQNRYLAQRYLVKDENEEGFADAVVTLFERFLEAGSSGSYYSDYFRGVDFRDSNKTELFDTLQNLTDQAQISDNKRAKIYKDILGRTTTASLATVEINDICLDSNISGCQSLKTFDLNSKEIYILVDNRVGEDKEIAVSQRGLDGYSNLIVPVVDDLGKELDIKIRIAKVATTEGIKGKLLKINDPSEVATDKTQIVAWIDPTDNIFDEERRYDARQRIILKVKERVINNEETMGTVILNLKNLINGHALTFNGDDFTQKYSDDSTSIYFTALDSTVGPTSGNWFGSGYTTLSIKVHDEDGVESTVKLRANNNSHLMNAGQNAGWDNTLKIVYDSNDNPTFVSGARYKTAVPFVIDARMWHKQSKVKDRMYINIDMLVE